MHARFSCFALLKIFITGYLEKSQSSFSAFCKSTLHVLYNMHSHFAHYSLSPSFTALGYSRFIYLRRILQWRKSEFHFACSKWMFWAETRSGCVAIQVFQRVRFLRTAFLLIDYLFFLLHVFCFFANGQSKAWGLHFSYLSSDEVLEWATYR